METLQRDLPGLSPQSSTAPYNQLLMRYADLKVRYFEFLDSSPKSKGHIRAYVGIRTWFHERKALSRDNDKYVAHVHSLEAALEDLQQSLASRSFSDDMEKALNQWREDPQPPERKAASPPLLPSPIPSMTDWQPNSLSLISLFSGAFGLDLGFMAAGFDLQFATDIDPDSKEVADRNLPSIQFVLEDFAQVSSRDILHTANLGVGDVDALVGGPPCQPFSTAGKRRGLKDPRASPLKGFVRAVKEIQPRAFVMEEVTGLKSARLKHVPISQRGKRPLEPEEQKGSAFEVVLEMLRSTGYGLVYGVLNAADYGAPQSRRRLIFIGLRDATPTLPPPTHSRHQPNLFGNAQLVQTTFWQATADLGSDQATYRDLSPATMKHMQMVPPGGHWRHLPDHEIRHAMGGAYHSGGGKMGFFRRLPWDDVSPTVVTSPTQKGTMLCHPEANRPLSVQEYARLQGFPDDWDLPGSAAAKYRLIGNAVPVHLSHAIAQHLQRLLNTDSSERR